MAKSGVTIHFKSHVVIDKEKFSQVAGNFAIGAVKTQCQKGEDRHGKKMRPYSEEYREYKVSAGRSGTPDINLTGGLLGTLKVLRKTFGLHTVTTVIGPDGSTSRAPPAGKKKDGTPRKQRKASDVPHNIVASYLWSIGYQFLGLSPKSRKALKRIILNTKGILKEKKGPDKK